MPTTRARRSGRTTTPRRSGSRAGPLIAAPPRRAGRGGSTSRLSTSRQERQMAGKPLSVPLPGFAPELRRERQNKLMGLALLTPAILLALLFLYYPLAFIVQMSFSLANTYLSPAGPVFTIANYQ